MATSAPIYPSLKLPFTSTLEAILSKPLAASPLDIIHKMGSIHNTHKTCTHNAKELF